jgi:hypothetical protein
LLLLLSSASPESELFRPPRLRDDNRFALASKPFDPWVTGFESHTGFADESDVVFLACRTALPTVLLFTVCFDNIVGSVLLEFDFFRGSSACVVALERTSVPALDFLCGLLCLSIPEQLAELPIRHRFLSWQL